MSNTKNDDRNYYTFYKNWAEMINLIYEDDEQKAKDLTFAIIRLFSTGELMDLGSPELNMMLQYTIAPGVSSSANNYIKNSQSPGRPKKLTPENERDIAIMRRQGITQEQIAKKLGVGVNTIGRSHGWMHYQDYIAPQNPPKIANNFGESVDTMATLHAILNDEEIPDF